MTRVRLSRTWGLRFSLPLLVSCRHPLTANEGQRARASVYTLTLLLQRLSLPQGMDGNLGPVLIGLRVDL